MHNDSGAEFLKPGFLSNSSYLEPSLDGVNSQFFVYNPNHNKSLSQQRKCLPIYNVGLEILYLLEKYRRVIILGSTSCGKSTQIPQYLLENGWAQHGFQICCTQPRTVAAISLAMRVAEEQDTKIGEVIGYCVRFENFVSENTRIKYVTDGVLLRELMSDPLLKKYSVVMIDEAHERGINTDLLLGLLLKIQKRRKDFKLIISSATIDALELKSFFLKNDEEGKEESVGILPVEGRQFPVDIFYSLSPVPDYLECATDLVIQIAKKPFTLKNNDILVFLTGYEELETVKQMIQDRTIELGLQIRSSLKIFCFSSLTPRNQQIQCFRRSQTGTRKVILSTNICETSVTIDGIGYVIDCGFSKVQYFNPKTNQNSLRTIPISQSSAKQRAGRAGRTAPGVCIRLYTEESYNRMRKKSFCEIEYSDLSMMILQLKALGIDDFGRFPFLTFPPRDFLASSLENLYALNALDEESNLTVPLGLKMAEVPLRPNLSKILFQSLKMGCTETILTILAMVSVPQVFIIPKKTNNLQIEMAKRSFTVLEGDHITLVNVYNKWVDSNENPSWANSNFLIVKNLQQAVRLRSKLRKTLRRLEPTYKVSSSTSKELLKQNLDVDIIRKCLVSGYFAHTAVLQPDGSYRPIQNMGKLYIHPSSIFNNRRPEWVVYHEVISTSKDYMHYVTEIKPEWLQEMAPHYFKSIDD